MALSCSKIKRSLQLPCQEKKGKTLAKTGTELHTALGILRVNPGERLSNSQSCMFGVLSEHEFETVFTRMTEDDRGFRFNQTFALFRCIELFFCSVIYDYYYYLIYHSNILQIYNHIIPTTLPPAKIQGTWWG